MAFCRADHVEDFAGFVDGHVGELLAFEAVERQVKAGTDIGEMPAQFGGLGDA